MAHPSLASLLAPGAKARNLDLQALLAIAQHEGASGRIGDGGHAFGPGQMNDAGGVLTGKLAGLTPEQKNAWAWGPQGINAWLDGVAKVASGRRGADAITHIARDYERPANVGAEIKDALAHYGGGSPSAPSLAAPQRLPMSVGAQPPSVAAPAGNLLASLVGRTNQSLGLGGSGALQSLLSGPVNAAWGDHPGSGATVGGKPGQGQAGLPPLAKPKHSGIAELLREGVGGPTHSTGPHIHAAFTDPKLELAAIQWAQSHGLHVGENPYVGGVAPVHAPHSYHTQTFPGLYGGKKLGQAIDVSGGDTSGFYQWLSGRR